MNCVICSWRRWDTQRECLPCVGSSWGWSRAARWAGRCSSAASRRSPDCGSALARRSPPHEPRRTSRPTTAKKNTKRRKMKNPWRCWDSLLGTGRLSLHEQFRSFWKPGCFLRGAADISSDVFQEKSNHLHLQVPKPNQSVNTVR